ncbi:MAG: 2-amino-4-hydroxy-6-hydroxymethyldihydropteridine diphosphokinase [Chloroflexi bacterium]|nr:2-amino-4-hydroxy-6-hydroxymethyldihydropteridine diphosphokinase [Chloroflexota bacterium]
MATVYIGLGSNQGRRELSLRRAVERLARAGRIVCVSSIYETEPQGYANQRWFLNAACQLETTLKPSDLLACTKEIERELGRQETFRNGPRTVDVDILLYDDLILEQPELQIPHLRLAERAFVLVPLAEIAPDVVHPVHKVSTSELETKARGKGQVWLWKVTPRNHGKHGIHGNA